MRGHRDLILVTRWGAVCALTALIAPFEAVRVVAVIPLALFFPGYAIAAATFPGGPLAKPMLATLSLGTSLAVLALGGLVLHFGPGRVGTAGWVILLLVVILAASRAAALRRSAPLPPSPVPTPPRPRRRELAMLAAGGGIAAAAAVLALAPLPADNVHGFTELWALDGNGPAEVVVGVRSQEMRRTGYRLDIRQGTRRISRTWFHLEPGESRLTPVSLGPSGRSTPVVAALFRLVKPNRPYRRVRTVPRAEALP